jgi:glycosyltransferase involved in cell wall biosynthesis
VGHDPLPRPRAYLNGSWTLLGRPRLEDLIGPFDVFHALHPSFPVATGRPGVLTVHDLLPMEQPGWSPWHERVGFDRTLRAALDRGWVITVDSDFVGRQLVQMLGPDPERVVTVPLGIGPEFSHPVDRAEQARVVAEWGLEPDRFFLAIGRISARKNVVTVLEALQGLGPGGPVLALAGRAGPEAAPVRQAIGRLGLESRVRLLGHVDDGQLVALLQAARGLVHPSLAEGFGLPVLEAFAAGTPVLASNGGSLPEIVGAAGILLDPSDPAAWAHQMAVLSGDDEVVAGLRRAGRARAAEFTWPRTADGVRRAHRLAADRA